MRRVLDTNVHIYHWGDKSRGFRLSEITVQHARKWAMDLTKIYNSNAILTPIAIEYLCGKGSRREVDIARAYLSHFEIADEGDIHAIDWVLARQISERVPREGGRRQLGDCLIRAICKTVEAGGYYLRQAISRLSASGSTDQKD
jgi:predicted nucleic acid-binding protein